MKQPLLSILALPVLLGSCDSIDAIGDKVNELKDAKEESAAGEGGANPAAVRDLKETDFQAFIKEPGRLNIVDYHAEWCGPCKTLAPILAEIVEANAGVVRLGKIDVDQAKELAREQGVSGIPDVRFYVDGKLVHQFTGAPPKAQLEELIATHSASISPASPASTTPSSAKSSSNEPPQSPSVTLRKSTVVINEKTPPAAPPTPKPIEEAMKPMEKGWLPPGVSPK